MVRFLIAGYLLIGGVVFFVGCKLSYQRAPVKIEPVADVNMVLADYAEQAIEASGGRSAWRQTDELALDCVVSFYHADGSYYVTAHSHRIYPWKGSIRMVGQEPQGAFTVEFSRQAQAGLGHRGASFPVDLCGERQFPELVLDLATAPVRLLDRGVKFSRSAVPVEKQGRRYYRIERVGGASGLWSEAVLYQSVDSGLIDLLVFTEAQDGGYLAARGYDYRQGTGAGVLVPRKIEIFQADARGALKQRLVEINYSL